MPLFYVKRIDIPGPLKITTREDSEGRKTIQRLSFCSAEEADAGQLARTAFQLNIQKQLNAYFNGQATAFQIQTETHGTPFQEACWEALTKIPYGKTITYGEQARSIGKPRASRAAGRANHFNPIAIIIPCHRVVGATGNLTGFAGGLDWKKFLLKLEQKKDS